MGRPPKRSKIVCPRCGGEGYMKVKTIRGREYRYIVHYDPTTKKITEHYAGPVHGYVSKPHEKQNGKQNGIVEIVKRLVDAGVKGEAILHIQLAILNICRFSDIKTFNPSLEVLGKYFKLKEEEVKTIVHISDVTINCKEWL